MNEQRFFKVYGVQSIFLNTMKKDVKLHLLTLYGALQRAYAQEDQDRVTEWVEAIIHYSRYWFCTNVEKKACEIHHRCGENMDIKTHIKCLHKAIHGITNTA